MDTKLIIFVQNTSKCVTLLQYIDRTISDINKAKIHVDIYKVNSKSSKLLTSKGIGSLPSMVDPTGKIYLGVTSIVEYIRDKISTPPANTSRIVKGGNGGIYQDYLMDLMYDTVEGKIIPKKDGDDHDDEAADFEKKLKEANVARASITTNPKIGTVDRKINTTENKISDVGADDNIAEFKEPISKACLSNMDPADRAMMSAYLDNLE